MLDALLKEIIAYLKQYNPNPMAPYHCNEHMEGVWYIAKEIWDVEKLDPQYALPDAEEVMAIQLMLACMFHDFGHTGGMMNDRENIRRAVKALKRFVLVDSKVINKKVAKKYKDSLGFMLWGAIALIDVTEYPFVKTPVNKLEFIIRDADLLYTTVRGEPEIVMDKLRMEIERSQGRIITYAEMAEGQQAFMSSAQLFTPTGKKIWDEKAAAFFTKLNDFAAEQAAATA
jgi:hypothetical protein